ncbi:MAG: hypothetical protein AB1512_10130 [Thermodesulfobacteriota bacterium]
MENGNAGVGVCGCKNLCREVEIPSDDELVALNAMRSIREKAKALREEMDRLQKTEPAQAGPERIRMQRQLDLLKQEWQEWEKKKNIAAKEKMVLLGHEDPDKQ